MYCRIVVLPFEQCIVKTAPELHDCSLDYLRCLKYLNLESLELRWIHNDLIMVYKTIYDHVNIKTKLHVSG